MTRLFALVFAWLLTLPAAAQLGLPADKGFPVIVRVGVSYVDIHDFDENAGTFQATIDLRIIWEDPRLRFPPGHELDPPLVYRGTEVAERLNGLWTPPVVLLNRTESAPDGQTALRTYPDGRAELMRRLTGTFSTPFTVTRFPFDSQALQVEIAMLEEPLARLDLQTRQDDLDFSGAAMDVALDGWKIGHVDLASEPLPGWYGAAHARTIVSLHVTRDPGGQVAAIFIPLFASLLIPLLTIWLNRMEDGQFAIESFELVNLIVGGLFAVIALNFTVNSDYGVLSSGDNAVNRLFALNYITLGICLIVNVVFYRYRLVEAWLGRYVQEQAFLYLAWAIPAVVLTLAAAIILVALV